MVGRGGRASKKKEVVGGGGAEKARIGCANFGASQNPGTGGTLKRFLLPGIFATEVQRGSLTAVEMMDRHTASTLSNLVLSAGICCLRSGDEKIRSEARANITTQNQ